jgi:hypothetical protein
VVAWRVVQLDAPQCVSVVGKRRRDVRNVVDTVKMVAVAVVAGIVEA